jgi:predicted DNA binding CopG/RHH family protein
MQLLKVKPYTQAYTRQRIDIRLPVWKIESIKKYCEEEGLTFTAYLEQALDDKMREDHIEEPKIKIANTWGNNLERMPL